MAINITTTNFPTEVLKHKGTVMVDFWAPWCGPCQILEPIIEELSKDLKDKTKIVKVNIDEEPQLADQYKVSSIPTIIIFKDGKVSQTLEGLRTKEDYLQAITD